MLVYRLASRRYALDNSEGARIYGGGWNRVGTAVIYASGTISLAALEVTIHNEAIPVDHRVIVIEVPASGLIRGQIFSLVTIKGNLAGIGPLVPLVIRRVREMFDQAEHSVVLVMLIEVAVILFNPAHSMQLCGYSIRLILLAFQPIMIFGSHVEYLVAGFQKFLKF